MSEITVGSKWAGRGHEVTFKVIALKGDAAWVEFDDESLGTLTTAYILEEYRETVLPKPFFSVLATYKFLYSQTTFTVTELYQLENGKAFAASVAKNQACTMYMFMLDENDFEEMEIA
jgi:hypothetical protein